VGTAKRERQKQNRAERRVVDARRYRTSLIKRRILKWGGIIAAIILGALLLVTFTDDDEPAATSTTTTEAPTPTTAPGATLTGDTPCPTVDGSAERTIKFEKAPTLCIDPTKTYTATFETSEGTVVAELDAETVPNTVNNFVVLSRYKYYDTSLLFRTDPSLDIIQGGGETNADNPGYTIEDEGGKFTYSEGDLVMARTSAPDSAGGQFFFATGPNVSVLDEQGTYVVFGRVTEGLDVLKSVMDLHVDLNNGLGGAPSRPVTVVSVTITES
jgi:cyclophilin family peptidyl-prolyl cis-trans isomerase